MVKKGTFLAYVGSKSEGSIGQEELVFRMVDRTITTGLKPEFFGDRDALQSHYGDTYSKTLIGKIGVVHLYLVAKKSSKKMKQGETLGLENLFTGPKMSKEEKAAAASKKRFAAAKAALEKKEEARKKKIARKEENKTLGGRGKKYGPQLPVYGPSLPPVQY